MRYVPTHISRGDGSDAMIRSWVLTFVLCNEDGNEWDDDTPDDWAPIVYECHNGEIVEGVHVQSVRDNGTAIVQSLTYGDTYTVNVANMRRTDRVDFMDDDPNA